MGFAEADTIERMLIVEVGTAWLMLQAVQAKLARLEGESGHSLRMVEALSRRVTGAHNRWIRATESLEKIRALRRVPEARTLKYSTTWGTQSVEDAEFAVVGYGGHN